MSNRNRVLRHASGTALAFALCSAGMVHAQNTPPAWSPTTPPEVTSSDSLNVNLMTGQPILTEPQLSIGAKGFELTHSFLEYVAADENLGVANYVYNPSNPVPTVTISLGKSSEVFTVSGNTYVSAQGSASTLVANTSANTLTYTKGDGTVAVFNTTLNWGPLPCSMGMMTSLTLPDGEQFTYYYENGPTDPGGTLQYLKTVVSNRSLMLKYQYGSFGTEVTAINTAVDYCDPNALSCTNLTHTWPTTYTSNSVTTSTGSPPNGQQAVVYTETNAAGLTRTRTYNTVWTPNGGQGQFISNNNLVLADEDGNTFTYTYVPNYFGTTNPLNANMISGVIKGNLSRSYTYNFGGGTSHTWISNATAASSGTNGSAFSIALNPSNSNYFSVLPIQKTVLGNNTNYTRDGDGRVTQVANPEGDYIQYTYDARGNFEQATHVSKNGSQSITYRAVFPTTCSNPKTCNEPTSTFDANNNETDYTYDPNSGKVATITKPADANGVRAQVQYTYTAEYAQVMSSGGTLVSQSTPIYVLTQVAQCASSISCAGTSNQHISNYTYDNNLFPTAVTQTVGDNSVSVTTTTTYDNMGNVAVVDGPRTDVDDRSYKTYDIMRRVVYEIGVDPDGSGPLPRQVVHHIYDNAGFEIQTEEGTGNATDGSDFSRTSYVTTTYNSAGLKSVAASYINGNSTPQTITQYSYDQSGRATCSTVRMNPNVFSTVTGTDACTLGTTGSYGPDRITLNNYDSGDEILEVDQGYGVTTANGFPQTLQRAYARYSYNPNGTKATEMDANGNKTMYIYDGFDRLSQIQYPSTTSGAGTPDTADYELFGYDSNSNKTSWRRRNGKTLSYTFDALNRETVRSVSDGSVQSVYSGYDLLGSFLYARYGSASGAGITNVYDGLERLSSTTDMNGRSLIYSYNQASAQASLQYSDGAYIGYFRDSLNRLTGLNWENGPGGIIAIGFDNLGRRAYLNRPAFGTAYSYDNLGRLTSLDDGFPSSTYAVTWNFSYTPANQIASASDTNTVFDYRETASSTTNNTYDGLNRDAGIAALSGGFDGDGNLANDGTRTFTYDVYNHLLTETAAGSSLSLVYDPLGRLASQTYNGTTTSFQYDGTNLIAEYNGSGSMVDRYLHGDNEDEPLVWFQGAQSTTPLYFVQDYHGSVIAYTDGSGNLQNLYKYGPFGEPKDTNNTTDFMGARFRYTGQTVIPEASLYYYKARVYDPIFGRFLQTDPIGSKDDLDLYAYTKDDPIDGADPSGDQALSLSVDVDVDTVGDDSVIGPRGTPLRPLGDLPEGSKGGPGSGKPFPYTPKPDETKPCLYCGEDTTKGRGPNQHNTDHIIPKSQGGNIDDTNKADSCRTCNLSKGARTPSQWYSDLAKGLKSIITSILPPPASPPSPPPPPPPPKNITVTV